MFIKNSQKLQTLFILKRRKIQIHLSVKTGFTQTLIRVLFQV